jgi:hypothetical protein
METPTSRKTWFFSELYVFSPLQHLHQLKIVEIEYRLPADIRPVALTSLVLYFLND